jgi:hypothetical protein
VLEGLDNSRRAIGGRACVGFGTARGKAVPRVPLRHGEGNKDHLTSFGGLAALSPDVLRVSTDAVICTIPYRLTSR